MGQVIIRIGRLACCIGLYFGISVCAFAAGGAGVVVNVEGSLSAKGADGALRPLAVWAKVLPGDTLFTGRSSYARVKFADGGEISLRPGTHFRIDDYHFDEQQPARDSASFNLLKGGLRALSGLIGKRGDPDSYGVKTATATAGIRGTKFGVLYCNRDCGDIPTPAGRPPEDGMHLDVEEGAVLLKNAAGAQLLHAGQFGFAREATIAPAVVPVEQGVRVEIPARIFEDRVKGVSDGETRETGDNEGAQEGKDAPKGEAAPNVCPI